MSFFRLSRVFLDHPPSLPLRRFSETSFSHRLPWFVDLLKSASSSSIIKALESSGCVEEECSGFLNMAIVYKKPKVLEYLLLERGFDPCRVYRYDSDRGLEFPSPALNESHCFYWNFGHFVGVTPLLTATQTRETEMMKILLKEGANPNAPSTLSLVDKGLMNIRPLHFAGISGDTERAKLLIDYGAGLNLTNEEGQAPLFYVCRRGDVEMMKLLLKYGANPALTAKGVGPLDWILQSPGLLKAYEGGRPEGGYDLSLT